MKGSLLALALILAVGCGSGAEKTTVTNADGTSTTATVNKSDGSMTMEGEGVNASLGGKTAITEDEVKLPFYPAAAYQPSESMKVETPTETSIMAVLTTTDEIGKVAAFYEEKVKGLKFNRFEAGGSVNYISQESKNSDGTKTSVVITQKGTAPVKISLGFGKEGQK